MEEEKLIGFYRYLKWIGETIKMCTEEIRDAESKNKTLVCY